MAVPPSEATIQSTSARTEESALPNRIETQSNQLITRNCTHCATPTLCSVEENAGPIFCCKGCQGAYELIHGWGLDSYYQLRQQLKHTGIVQVTDGSQGFAQFDDHEFLGESTPIETEAGLVTCQLAVHGLHCGACSWLIENAAARIDGLKMARVNMAEHTIRFVFDVTLLKLSDIAALLNRLGYQLSPIKDHVQGHLQQENRRQLVQIAVAGFLAANAMWIAVALYAGEFTGVATEHRFFLTSMGTILGLASVLGPGRTFFRGAWGALQARTPHMDLPIALGLCVGSIVGTISGFSGQGQTYFDSLSTLVFLLLIGRWIQFRQQQRASKAVDLMLRITPQYATRINSDATECKLLVSQLSVGDLVKVAAGESVPVDGIIVAGNSALDLSLLTGESLPVAVSTGEFVAAGAANTVASLCVRVQALGRDTRIGKVMQAVENAAVEKTPLVQLADRIGGVFVVAVTILGLITFGAWVSAGWVVATSHATSLLIVACPCALALATPLAIAVSLGRAARSGILIRDGSVFQHLSNPGIAWFDKTGTLTEGRLRVQSILGSLEALQLAGCVERHCQHPVAEALELECRSQRLETDIGTAELLGVGQGGVEGRVGNRLVHVGNQNYMEQHCGSLNEHWLHEIESLVERGHSPLLISVERQVQAVVGLADPPRRDAQSTLEYLNYRGWQIGILSGDHPQIVRRLGASLGLDQSRCLGGLSPEDKLSYVKQSRNGSKKTVLMVGDGVNDAAALAAADVGVAVRGSVEVSLQAAPVFVASGNLKSIEQLVKGSMLTNWVIYRSFAASLGYNLVAVGLAVAGFITPLIAAVLMPISSITVLGMTLLSRTFGR